MELDMQERRQGDRKHRLLATLVLLGSFSFGLFVWPTPWRYDRVGKTAVRTHRVTGDIEFLNLQGWQPALPPLDFARRGRIRRAAAPAIAPCVLTSKR